MARGRHKVNTDTLDAKIEHRNEMRKEELMEAVIKSDRSYAEIMAFIKGAPETE